MSQHTQNIDAYFANKYKNSRRNPIVSVNPVKVTEKIKVIEDKTQEILKSKLVLADKIAVLEQNISIYKSENEYLKTRVNTLTDELNLVENVINRMYDSSVVDKVDLNTIDEHVRHPESNINGETLQLRAPTYIRQPECNTNEGLGYVGRVLNHGNMTLTLAYCIKDKVVEHIMNDDFTNASIKLSQYGVSLCVYLPDTNYSKIKQTDVHVVVNSDGLIKDIYRVSGWDVRIRPRHPKHIYKRREPPPHFHVY